MGGVSWASLQGGQRGDSPQPTRGPPSSQAGRTARPPAPAVQARSSSARCHISTGWWTREPLWPRIWTAKRNVLNFRPTLRGIPRLLGASSSPTQREQCASWFWARTVADPLPWWRAWARQSGDLHSATIWCSQPVGSPPALLRAGASSKTAAHRPALLPAPSSRVCSAHLGVGAARPRGS